MSFDELYQTQEYEKLAFGEHWCGPDKFENWKDVLIATYAAEDDGQSVEIYCCAAPARFYTIKVLPGKDSMGKRLDGYELATGSSEHRLAHDIASAIANGMLSLHRDVDKG